MESQPNNRAWHLDRTVNLSIVIVLLAQFAGGVWWVSAVSNRLETEALVNERQDSRLTLIEGAMNDQAINAATMTAQIAAVRETLAELKSEQAETNRLLRNLSNGGNR